MSTKTQTEAYKYSPERESRVAEALRENLRKRKVQKQAKQDKNNKETQ